MQVVAETITEYYIMEGKREGLVEGERKGKREGLVEGKREGEIVGQLKILEDLYADRLIEPSVYKSRSRVLRKQLKALQSDLE